MMICLYEVKTIRLLEELFQKIILYFHVWTFDMCIIHDTSLRPTWLACASNSDNMCVPDIRKCFEYNWV